MDAGPLLAEIARQMQKANLEAVLIGNAAAALQGAPVTTIDFDFLFRSTPRNLSKLKLIAEVCGPQSFVRTTPRPTSTASSATTTGYSWTS